MSTDIPLRFETHFDPDLFAEAVSFKIVRLLANVDFKTKDGWSLKYEAIIDTGSPINIIPFEDFLSAGILYSNYPQNSASITI